MCEPTHSIVQYPDRDEGGNPTDSIIQAGVGRTMELGKRILSWFHFSKMGSGHSEAVGMGRVQLRLMPRETLYEANWWDRTVVLDSFSSVANESVALECATEYAHRVSIGNLTMLRQFLKSSLRKTDSPNLYVQAFLQRFLSREGREIVVRKLCRLGYSERREVLSDSVVKTLLGMTRKRRLLVPAWADDDSLWKT